MDEGHRTQEGWAERPHMHMHRTEVEERNGSSGRRFSQLAGTLPLAKMAEQWDEQIK